MSMKEDTGKRAVVNNDVATTLINKNGKVVDVNESGLELYGYSREEMEGMSILQVPSIDELEHGRILGESLSGDKEPEVFEMNHADGYMMEVKIDPEVVTVDGEPHVLCESELIEVLEEEPEEKPCEDVNEEKMKEVGKNVRVETPSGKIPLNALMFDIQSMQNEIEQAKHGAYEVHRALNDRLEEEQKRNPDSCTCAVIEDVRDMAEDLYKRIETDDE